MFGPHGAGSIIVSRVLAIRTPRVEPWTVTLPCLGQKTEHLHYANTPLFLEHACGH